MWKRISETSKKETNLIERNEETKKVIDVEETRRGYCGLQKTDAHKRLRERARAGNEKRKAEKPGEGSHVGGQGGERGHGGLYFLCPNGRRKTGWITLGDRKMVLNQEH